MGILRARINPLAKPGGRYVSLQTKATVEDLYRVPENGKAELVGGVLVMMAETGFLPGRAGGEIYASLRDYEEEYGSGYALPDNVGFLVNLPDRRNVEIYWDTGRGCEQLITDLAARESFSPDAAYYVGEPTGADFLDGALIFAVEVRSKHDYGERAEKAMARKRSDYFAAGTQVVWDVDVLKGEWVKVYRIDSPDRPTVYGRGELAEAEPALPGWTLQVDRLLPKSAGN
ncbi:MAG: Uma2 family endonuclease [Cyanobacteriota bacterium]|nr:Uma2 family endonuclease [Cyanobacteriota bacterium]